MMVEIQSELNLLLTNEDADMYRVFRKNREKFLELFKAGVFNTEVGQVTININNGEFQNIYIKEQKYKREK